MLTSLIADASTQPAGGFASWTSAEWISVITVLGSVITGLILTWRRAGAAKTVAHEAKADAAGAVGYADATQKSLDRLSNRASNTERTVTDIALKVPPPGSGTSPLLLLPLLLIPFVVGCGTSASYRALVAKTYPVVASRMDKYPLTDQEKAEVATLRQVSTDRNQVRYETARPAWEAVAPDYRRYVSEDTGEHLLPGKTPAEQERRRSDWMKTADILDEAQDTEAENHRSLFGN